MIAGHEVKTTGWGGLIAVLFILVSAQLAVADTAPAGRKTVISIHLPQLEHTRNGIVSEVLFSRVGEPYSEVSIEKDKERLDRLGILNRAEVTVTQSTEGIVLAYDLD